jgi:hypothetical protein
MAQLFSNNALSVQLLCAQQVVIPITDILDFLVLQTHIQQPVTACALTS